VRVNHGVSRGPLKDGESTVLRRHQRNGIALIVNELRGRLMPGSAEFFRVRENRGSSFNRFRDCDSFHPVPTLPARDFGAKAE